ncbi:hypothetical protein SAMD00019534_039510 [Acytostelium subglobosum LB1]|uniref:hypothetical protein n=1 Tax=Acytostelium subglobosum LB1 TaxID=1410327 RepID=UPI0006449770|nr:hypothetical protein SAMD00019534_039510 [Acytostelium subglobosum LB1]GAM20776.1 hypothetical protein SAMD00019534_039510 [Acytostelium subglobosum LB1]|eukprot:XP_012755910.1 hypothetical protein SAMD00019534_039510 [Acytostelium subglobosum LB1]
MNIRDRKSNHRAVTNKFDSDVLSNELSYFAPLLKEKKTTIRVNALKNIIDICTHQERIEQIHELDVELANSICDIIAAPNREQEEVTLAARALKVIAVQNGLSRYDFHKTIKGGLSSVINDTEDHVSPATISSALDAVSFSCFMNTSYSDSYENTIEMFADIIQTQKNKTVLNSALKGWLLMLTRLDKSKISKHMNMLDKIIELTSSSFTALTNTAGTAMAFLISEMDDNMLEDNEDDEEDVENDDEEAESVNDYDDVEDEDYSKYQDRNARSQDDDDNTDDDDNEHDDDDEDYEDDEENEIVSMVENLILSNNEKGKKKAQSKTLLRKIVKTLKEGDSPRETLKIDNQPFYFQGWRKYIQLHEIKSVLKNSASFHWTQNEDLRKLIGIEMRSASDNNQFLLEQRHISNVRSKLRTKGLTKERRDTSGVYSYHHGENDQ